MLALANAFAGLILGFMAGAALADAASRLVAARALPGGLATAGGVALIWSSALLGAVLGWHW